MRASLSYSLHLLLYSLWLAAWDKGICCISSNRINYSLSKAKALLYTVAVIQHSPARPGVLTPSHFWAGADWLGLLGVAT